MAEWAPGSRRARESFYDVLTRAVADLSEHGYDSVDRLVFWTLQLREAAERSLVPEQVLQATLRQTLGTAYRRMVDNGGLLKRHPGIGRFTLDKVRPQLRGVLERRIVASADLIKLNRKEAIEKTLRRFSGWGSSVPPGGAAEAERNRVKCDIRKALAQLPFEERRVLVDQGHKFVAALSNVLASDGGAIAAVWHSHWREAGYNYREPHKERDGEVYAIKGNWALSQGLMKAGPAGYTDDVTQPGEEIFCRCYHTYLYRLRDLPPEMLTDKGVEALAAAKAQVQRDLGR
jgi:hypothetical protein